MPNILRMMPTRERVVVTGVGLCASLGKSREAVWNAVRSGECGVRHLPPHPMLKGLPLVGAWADIAPLQPGEMKNLTCARIAAREAIDDSQHPRDQLASERFGCASVNFMADLSYFDSLLLDPSGGSMPRHDWFNHWLPNSATAVIANEHRLLGPRLTLGAACASGTVALNPAVRAITEQQADAMLVVAGEMITPLMAAGFHNMRALAWHADPQEACRPFDANRGGFVMGEGGAAIMLERLDHALERHAPIYAEIVATRLMCDARHPTALEADTDSLSELIEATLDTARLDPTDVQIVNTHGTGTQQNDRLETHSLRRALGPAAENIAISANKGALGHLVNAAGVAELALTLLSLRDGYAPPTRNRVTPDPDCDLDCVPLVGRRQSLEHALKLSVAFGGHLAAVIMRRWAGRGARESLLPSTRAA